MAVLVAGLVIFLGVHSVAIFAPGLRTRALGRWGEGTWKAAYGLISLIGFALLVYGFGVARQSPVVLHTASLDAARHPSSDAAGISAHSGRLPARTHQDCRQASDVGGSEILGVRPSARQRIVGGRAA